MDAAPNLRKVYVEHVQALELMPEKKLGLLDRLPFRLRSIQNEPLFQKVIKSKPNLRELWVYRPIFDDDEDSSDEDDDSSPDDDTSSDSSRNYDSSDDDDSSDESHNSGSSDAYSEDDEDEEKAICKQIKPKRNLDADFCGIHEKRQRC